VQFKPLRGGVYKQWIKTEWWAWAGECARGVFTMIVTGQQGLGLRPR
jgi:hypothetical protein